MLTDCQISGPIALGVCGLSKRYAVRSQFWRRKEVNAAAGVSFEISAGTTLALVGTSGSGKSTIARCVTRLERPDTGDIWLNDVNIARLSARELQPFRHQIQMIFQDPSTAMNPRMTAAEIIEEPLLIQNRAPAEQRRSRAAELMEEVALSPDWLDRRITEFSGGQKQRIAIARALTLQPKILVLDEALSGLDLSTQAEIAQMLRKLQAKHSLTYLLISHDLGLVARIAESVAVISAGRIVEQGPTHKIISDPQHAETRELIASAQGVSLGLARGTSA
jgi:ABC-type glutathione transport system ATPase component